MAGAGIDVGALTAVLKTKYNQRKFNLIAYDNNPFFALVNKRTDFGGRNKLIGLRNGTPYSVSATYPSGSTFGTSTYNGFTVTRAKVYGLAGISGEAIAASKGNENALVDALDTEMKGVIHSVTRHIAIMAFRNGGGARGQISASSNVATQTITLANINDITNFELNMLVNSASTDGTSGSLNNGGAAVQIVAIDRQAGTLTCNTSAWNATNMTSVAASHYLFATGKSGDTGDFGTVMKGTQGWCPLTAPAVGGGDSWFGVDRSSDPTRLAGVTYTGNGAPIEETLIEVAWRVVREGGKPSHCFLNPRDYSTLVRALGSKVIYDRMVSPSDEPKIGFKAVEFDGPQGPIKVLPDLNQPQGYGSMLQLDTWSLESAGGAPRILDDDGQTILRDSTTDSYVVRVGAYLQLTCEAPGWNSSFTI